MSVHFLKNLDLYKLIQMVCHSVPAEHEVTPLVRLCIRLCMGYLRYKETLGYRIRELHLNTDQDENIAVDAVADLFERSQSSEFSPFFALAYNNAISI